MPIGAFIVVGAVFIVSSIIATIAYSAGKIEGADCITGFLIGLGVCTILSIILVFVGSVAKEVAFQEKSKCIEAVDLEPLNEDYLPAYVIMYKGPSGTEYGYMEKTKTGAEFRTIRQEYAKVSTYVAKGEPRLETWEMRYENDILNWLFGTHTRYYFNIPVNSVAIGPGF